MKSRHYWFAFIGVYIRHCLILDIKIAGQLFYKYWIRGDFSPILRKL